MCCTRTWTQPELGTDQALECAAPKSVAIADVARAHRRAMEFIIDLLRRLHDDRQTDLPAAASAAYEETLHPFHGWITSSVFTLAMKVCCEQRPCARPGLGHLQTHGSHMRSQLIPQLSSLPCAAAWLGCIGCVLI